MFTTFVQFLFKLRFPEGQGGMKETFGNSGGERGFIFLHKNGNSGEVEGLSWNSLRGGGMDIFWNCTLYGKGRRGGLMVSALDSGSGGPGSSPGLGTALCSWARYFTLIVPLSTQVYKWVPVNLLLGVTLQWTSIPSREE